MCEDDFRANLVLHRQMQDMEFFYRIACIVCFCAGGIAGWYLSFF